MDGKSNMVDELCETVLLLFEKKMQQQHHGHQLTKRAEILCVGENFNGRVLQGNTCNGLERPKQA